MSGGVPGQVDDRCGDPAEFEGVSVLDPGGFGEAGRQLEGVADLGVDAGPLLVGQSVVVEKDLQGSHAVDVGVMGELVRGEVPEAGDVVLMCVTDHHRVGLHRVVVDLEGGIDHQGPGGAADHDRVAVGKRTAMRRREHGHLVEVFFDETRREGHVVCVPRRGNAVNGRVLR